MYRSFCFLAKPGQLKKKTTSYRLALISDQTAVFSQNPAKGHTAIENEPFWPSTGHFEFYYCKLLLWDALGADWYVFAL